MTGLDPRAVLRHRAPAVLLSAVRTFTGRGLVAVGAADGVWPWPKLLEAAAQAAGLLAGARDGGLANTAVVADYREVRVHTPVHHGAVEFHATLDRRILHFRRCRIEARAADGTPLLSGSVTLAPPAPGTG
jgi:hypothetical protein